MDKRGCECSFALPCQEAFLILRDRKFNLVLSPTSLRDGTLYSIMNLLEGSDTTVFYSHAVERGCWWLLALWRGEKCFGSSALRPSEFVPLLDQTVLRTFRAMPLRRRKAGRCRFFRADVFVMSPLRSRVELAAANPARLEKQELAKRQRGRVIRSCQTIWASRLVPTDELLGENVGSLSSER